MIGLPVYELWRGQQDSAEKSALVNSRLSALEEGTEEALRQLELVARLGGGRSDFL